jgi:hypothetical protein
MQEPAPVTVELRLRDGSVIYGVVERETAQRLVLRTLAGGLLDVDRAQVLSLEPAMGRVVAGQFWRADANATRLLFAPTGRSLKKGEGYIGVYEFLLPFVQVGITDRLTIGAGTPLIFFGDETSRPVWVTPKYQFYTGSRTSAAVGFGLRGGDDRLRRQRVFGGRRMGLLPLPGGRLFAVPYWATEPTELFPEEHDEGRRRSGSHGWRGAPRAPAREAHHRELRLREGRHRRIRRALSRRAPLSRSGRVRANHRRGCVRAGADCQLRVDVRTVAWALASTAPVAASDVSAPGSRLLLLPAHNHAAWSSWGRGGQKARGFTGSAVSSSARAVAP